MKNKHREKPLLAAIILSAVMISACTPAAEAPQIEPLSPATDAAAIQSSSTAQPEPTAAAAETARYTLTFSARWSTETHPDNYDPSAHFSPFIAYTHNKSPDALIFQENSTATDGMEQMAETGATDLLIAEVNTIIAAGKALGFVQGARIDSPGVDTGVLDVSQTFSQITFVSMIAPSPDWFVFAKTNLFRDGQWVPEVTLDLISYDSGTDSGQTLTAADIDTIPREGITILPQALQKMGTLTFTLEN